MDEVAQFTCGCHSFAVVITEERRVHTTILYAEVKCRQGTDTGKSRIAVFAISQGDHVWNTLVGDWEQNGILKLAPIIPYLQFQAEEFACEHPEPLEFGSPSKAAKFSKAILQRPVDLSGPALAQRLRAGRTGSEF